MHHYKPHKYKKKVRCLAQADNMENLLITFIFIVYVICIYLVLYTRMQSTPGYGKVLSSDLTLFSSINLIGGVRSRSHSY